MRRCLGCFTEISEELEICPYCGYIEGAPAQEAIHMNPGTILAGRYIIGNVVGFGGFGVTYAAWDGRLEHKVAIKEYLPSEFSTRMPGQNAVTVFNGEKSEQYRDGLNKFVDEARRLAKFQNEDGIVKVFDCISENDTAYLIMEYLEGVTLTDYLKEHGTIPEDEAVKMLMPIMESLKSVHAEGILHRDLAPDNILITNDGKIKLIDFGASRYATTSHSRSLTVIVKPGYSPEEQYRSRGDQGPHTDVYSIAATLYKMVTGVTPPDALERRAKVETTKKDIIVDPRRINRSISPRFENAIMNALNVQIEDRTQDISQFIEELQSETPVKRRYGNIKRIDFYRWPLWMKIAVPALATCIVTFGVLLATGVISFKSMFTSEVVLPDGYDRVPYVVNLEKHDAAELIEEAGFNYQYGKTVISEYLDKNVVVSQDPESGGIYPRNSVITLVICEGDGTDPGLLYKPEDEVTGILEENEIGYLVQTEYSNTEAGLTSRIVLEDGTEIEFLSEIPEGESVTIYVSIGLEPVEIPDFYGMTIEEATELLYELGLVPDEASYVYAVSDEVEPGQIFDQSIAPGQEVTLGTALSFSIAVEEETELIEVPDVVGMEESTAKNALQNGGFVVTVYQEPSSSVEEGYVIRQNPISGSLREENAGIIIYVSSGVPEPSEDDDDVEDEEPAEIIDTPTPTPIPATPTETPQTVPTATPVPDPSVTGAPGPGSVVTPTPTPKPSSMPTPTPKPSSTPTPTPIVVAIDPIDDVEIHRENSEVSANVSIGVSPSNATVNWESSDDSILSIETSGGSSATLVYNSIGTVTVTVTASYGGVSDSRTFEVRCYNEVAVYSDWGSQKYQLSPVTESSTVMADGDEVVVVSTQYYVELDYYLYTSTNYRQYYPSAQSGRTCTWHWATDQGTGCTVVTSSDGGVSPDGWSSIAPGSQSSGTYRGYNSGGQTGYLGEDGRIFFVVGSHSEDQTEHRYYYRERTVSYVVTCE